MKATWSIMSVLKTIAIALLLGFYGNQAFSQPSDKDFALTTKVVAALMSRAHIKKPDIDAEFCSKWFGKYIDTLDPMHLYFLDSDISEFRTLSAQLPTLVDKGSPEFCKLVTARYQKRVEAALAHANQRVEQGFDFSIDEEIQLHHTDWPKSIDDRNERWRMQLKHDLLLERSAEFVDASEVEFVKTRYESIRKQAKAMSFERATKLYLDSFCLTVDPHSGYITPTEYKSFTHSIIVRYSIGVLLNFQKGRAIIRSYQPSYQAAPAKYPIVGCELLAIRTDSGVVHNVREIDFFETGNLIRYGLEAESSLTLELYDELRQRRFSVNWLRKRIDH